MKKTVLNRISQAMAVCMLSMAAITSVVAQTAGGVSNDSVFATELKLVEGLKVYNAQLADQLKAQAKAKDEIRASIAQSKALGPQVVPVLQKMLVALERFVKADLPFHRQQRLDSVNDLKALMLNSEANTSDRYRNIMDIYSIETEYGNTYEAYPDSIQIGDTDTPVDMLRVGRLALFYQTKDQKNSGVWDKTSGTFKALDSSHNRNIRKAIKVAAKTIAPELMTLPIPAPEGV